MRPKCSNSPRQQSAKVIVRSAWSAPPRGALVCCLALACFFSPQIIAAQARHLSLAGTWHFQLDRENNGLKANWFTRTLAGQIKLPGSLPEQGIGDDISLETKWTGDIIDKSWFTAPEYAKYRQPGNIKVPFWLQPTKYYSGVAWYQRDIEIPKDWAGKRVVLTLERPHWETRVWVDGSSIGTNQSLSTAHQYELGTGLIPGKHQLTIRVDNSLIIDIGVNSHCISDHTQGNWNGIVGDLSLAATDPVWLADLQAYPHVAAKSVTVRGVIKSGGGAGPRGKVDLVLKPSGSLSKQPVCQGQAEADEHGAFETELSLGETAALWDEFRPNLYRLTASISGGTDSRSINFGLREISTGGTQLALNGHKIFIRGTLECCIFPKTGHPPTDVQSWKRILAVAKAHGLNLLRFHSWCPPEAAFEAADEMGFYYQVETCWANQSTTIGDGKPVDQWVYDETDRILKAYGNHPSFLLMPYGNEPGGKKANAYLAKYVAHFKALDPRRLWTSGSGWPQLAENQFHITPDPRIQAWGEGLKSRINHVPPETTTDYRAYVQQRSVPVISHEIGQWCVYPNFDEIPKYTGYLKPKNFEIFRETLAEHHMSDLAHQFLLASGKLQTLCYKEDIESALRTPGMAGFELLDLHDFPGQGTALVGVLDPFWDEKAYVTAKEYSRFCNSTVPLARLAKRVFTTDEKLEADIEVAHFGPEPLRNCSAFWMLVNGKHVQADGDLPAREVIPIGNGTSLGHVTVDLSKVSRTAKYQLQVTLWGSYQGGQAAFPGLQPSPLGRLPERPDALGYRNEWDIWVYPADVSTQAPRSVTEVQDLDARALTVLQGGGSVLLSIPPNRVKGDRLGNVALGFSSIFWNTAWTGRQPPHTLGILCPRADGALADFPTEYHSNWQWWYLLSRAGAMILDDLPPELRPTIQVIDDWVTNRKLGLLFEAKVGRGKLVVCSIDLQKDLERNPVARQLRRSLLDYMASNKFHPAVRLSPEQVRGLMTDSRAHASSKSFADPERKL